MTPSGRAADHAPRRALASNAARTKSWPSRLSPFSATNRSPSLRVRVSMESPLTAKRALAWPRVAASASACGPQVMPRALPTRQRGLHRLVAVGERMHLAVDILAGLMALARQHQHIARLQCGDRRRGWPRARSPISRAPGAAARISLADGGGIFAAGIVVGDDHVIGQRGRRWRPSADACPCRGRRRSRTPHAACSPVCGRNASSTFSSESGVWA